MYYYYLTRGYRNWTSQSTQNTSPPTTNIVSNSAENNYSVSQPKSMPWHYVAFDIFLVMIIVFFIFKIVKENVLDSPKIDIKKNLKRHTVRN